MKSIQPLIAAFLACSSLAADEPKPQAEIDLTCAESELLIGEPLVLSVKLTNVGKSPLRYGDVHLDRTGSEIGVFTSFEGRSFQRYHLSIFNVNLFRGRRAVTLKPAESKTYTIYVLYSKENNSKLAMPKTGRYRITVSFPLHVRPGATTREETEGLSPPRPLEITVNMPEGDDRVVWEQINHPEFLRFLQTGADPQRQKKPRPCSTLAMELLKRHPKTGYADSLRSTLRAYYQWQRGGMIHQEFFADEQLAELRKVLDIKDPADPALNVLFPDDPLMDLPVTYHYPEYTPASEIFTDFSQQTGVSLRVVDPQLSKRRLITRREETQLLREAIKIWAVSDAKWIKDGDGYMLVPDERPKNKVKEPHSR